MLIALSIRDVVLIETLDLDIEPGFTALTGETGAGKSILLDALGLALGERADRGLVRHGAERAQASAIFEIGDLHPAIALLEELDLPEAEDGRIAQVGEAWRTLDAARSELDEAEMRARRASTDRDYLAHVLAELQKLGPKAGEEAALDAERRALMGSEKAATALKDATDALADGKAEQRMAAASRALSRVGKPEGEGADALSKAVDQAAASLERALSELSDAQGWMAR
eukprot:gene26095-26269_t